VFTDTLELDLASVVPSLAGPKRPQDKVALPDVDDLFNGELKSLYGKSTPKRCKVDGAEHDIGDGDVVIAAITSCTNTSNPDVLIAAGLVAKKANERASSPSRGSRPASRPGRRWSPTT
jgi:aconitate hydratase